MTSRSTSLMASYTTMGFLATLGAVWALVALLFVVAIALVAFGGFWGAAIAYVVLGVGLRLFFDPFIKKHDDQ